MSEGISAATKERNVGAVAAPEAGPAKTIFADSFANVAVSVPVEVTGEPETAKMDGIDKPTLKTVPALGVIQDKAPPVVLDKICPFEAGIAND